MKVYSYTRPKEGIFDYRPWYLAADGGWQACELIDGAVHGKGLIAVLEGFGDRDQAHRLIGCDVAVRRDQLPAPAPGEYYWVDLIGKDVVNARGEALGTVADLMETGANDVLVVRGKTEHLIPFVQGIYILEVDHPGNRIVVDWDSDY